MKKLFLVQGIIAALVFFTGGCASDSSYCCTSNDQCGSVHGKQTFCTAAECGQCEAPDNPLQVVANPWKDAVVGKPYEVELDASGGFSPYEWVGLSKLKDPDNKLAWLILEKDPNDSTNSKAYLRNSTNNGQPLLPSTATTDTDELTIEVTVRDNTQHGDSGGVVFSHVIKINKCGEASDCTELPGDAACVDAVCNEGNCEYTLKSTDTVCLAGGCRDGFIYNEKKCDTSGICVAPNPEGTSCNGYQCSDATACKTSCSIQTDCAGTLLCKNDNTCTSPQALGSTCTVDGECASNHCANGRCCENACNGLCQACGTNGFCNQMPTDDSRCGTIDCSGLDLDSSCRTYSDLTANRCASPGACKTANSSSWCTVFTKHPGAVCRASTDATCDPAELCDGNGDCPTNAFASNGTACGSGNCAACTNGVCGKYQANCASGNCGICWGSGSGSSAVWNCQADNSKCTDPCRPCSGSGAAWSCDYAPPAVTLSAANFESPIPVEWSTTLTWNSPCATSCDPSANPTTGTWEDLLGNQGSSTQSPTVTTTYYLACTSAPGKTTTVSTTVNVAQWADTTNNIREGYGGETCDHWLSETGQSGIQGSGPRVYYNGDPHHQAGTIVNNYCVYVETCHSSGYSDYEIALVCPSTATEPYSNIEISIDCWDWCSYGGFVRTAFRPRAASNENNDDINNAKTQTRR